MKLLTLGLAIILSLVLLGSFGPAQADDNSSDNSTEVQLKVEVVPPPPPPPPPVGVGAPGPPPPPPPGTTDVRGMVTAAGRFTRSVTATSVDRLCTLTIPTGTVGLTKELEPLTKITMLIMDEPPPPPPQANVIGLVYDFQPSGATFDPPITLTRSYDPDALPEGVAEEDLVIAYYDEEAGKWVELECVVDTDKNTITASVPHFTTFAIIGIPPTAFTSSSLVISPAEIAPDEKVNIGISVANTGGREGSYTAVLKINGVREAEKSVTIAAGSSQTVTFSVSRKEAGSYSVAVDGWSGSFTVVAPPPPPPVGPPPEPAAFSVSNLTIQPVEVQPKETVTITVLVANTGGWVGSYTIVLKVNGVKEAEKRVTIAAGESQVVSFTVAKEDPGSYSVTADGLSGSFTISAAPAPPEEVPAPPEKPPINWPMVGGIVAATIAVGLLIFFLVRRRRLT